MRIDPLALDGVERGVSMHLAVDLEVDLALPQHRRRRPHLAGRLL
jgi:hypothetical protein